MGLSSASSSFVSLPDHVESTWQFVNLDHINTVGAGQATTVGLPSKRHRRGQTEGPRRFSMFRSRGRSNTVSDFEKGHRLSPSASISSEPLAHEPEDKRPQSTWSDSDHSDTPTKGWVARGSKLLKKQNSKFNLSSSKTADWVEEQNGDPVDQSHSRGNSRHGKIGSTGNDFSARPRISKPYNFQHLAHTQARQLPEIRIASQEKRDTDHSATRTSQPTQGKLRGICAEDVKSRPVHPTSHEPVTPPSISPLKAHASRPSSVLSIKHPGTLSRSRSIDNFSQPSPRTYRIPRSPTSPPSRTSSRGATRITPDFFSDHHHATTEERELLSMCEASLDAPVPVDCPELSSQGFHLGQTGDDDGCQPHAITTPDDVAFPLQPPMLLKSTMALADVPEEDELYSTQRAPMEGSRPMTVDSNLRHAKSFPSNHHAKHRRDASSSRKSMGRPDSALIEASLINADEPEDAPLQSRQLRHRSTGIRGVDACWDDIIDFIDFCYQHEAEADCDFDWDRISTYDMPSNDLTHKEKAPTDPCRESDGSLSRSYEVLGSQHQVPDTPSVDTANYSQSHQLPRLQTSLPDLDFSAASSAKSSMASLRGAVTPLLQLSSPEKVKFTLHPSKSTDTLSLDPSFFSAHESDGSLSHDDSSQKEFAWDQAGTLNHLPCNVAPALRKRSSRPALSRHASSESVLLSCPASATRTRRNTPSSGSLPEIACSKNYRQNAAITTKQIADRIAALSVISKTPEDPANPPQEQSITQDNPTDFNRSVPKHHEDNETNISSSPANPQDNTTSVASFATRLRSNSVASSSSSSASSSMRVSYSLFPSISPTRS
ncbi:MAG: hypothetical protein Q9186_001068 [Xanthomendoza sp. 1 TL-2023]